MTNIVSDIIQIAIAFIMIIANFLAYLSINKNSKDNENSFFSGLCQQDRTLIEKVDKYDRLIRTKKTKNEKLNLRITSDKILFGFYEQLSILFFNNSSFQDFFIDYFLSSFCDVYTKFINSPLLETFEDRITEYDNLSKLFNYFGLSIKRNSFIEGNFFE